MTGLATAVAASKQMLAELRGDPRYTDSDTPSPAYIARCRDNTAALQQRHNTGQPMRSVSPASSGQ